jgi:hypothetical protein
LYHLYRGELDLVLRLDEDLLCLSSQRNATAGLVLDHISSGRDLFFVGSLSHLGHIWKRHLPSKIQSPTVRSAIRLG